MEPPRKNPPLPVNNRGGAPLWNRCTNAHLKTTAPMLKCSNTLSLFIAEVRGERFLWRFFLIGASLTYRCTRTFMNNDTSMCPFSRSTTILYNKITCTK
jgi:hypothetical protein